MKKVPLGSTALALVGAMALPANAAEWTLRAGGFMEQYVGSADGDTGTVSVSGSGSVGEVSVGDGFSLQTPGTTILENEGDKDAQRFTYFTPRFSGFKLGLSYAGDGLQDSKVQGDADPTLTNIFDIGANYMNSFGGVKIAVSGRWSIADAPGGLDPDIWSAGANLGYAGFTIGGSYADLNDAGAGGGARDGKVWDLGVSYETGPWGFSVTFLHGLNADDENPGFDEELDRFLLGASYRLARGLELNAYGAYLEFDEKVGDGGGRGGDDLEAWVIGTAVKISF